MLLRSFVGKAGEQSFMQQTDEEVLDVVLHDLRKIMSIPKQPDFYKVTRLQNAIPYVVGHLDWVRDVKSKIQSSLPGVLLAGASYSGVGVPDCIDQGKKAVSDVALANGGGIRTQLDAGDITKKNLYTLLPFENNTLSVVEVT